MKHAAILCAWLGFGLIAPRLGAADDPAALAGQAQTVLKTHCYHCHGQDGAVEGGFNYVLDLEKLVARKKVVPGKADDSPLFKRLVSGKMPPPDVQPRPSDSDIALIKQWIDAGAATAVQPPARPLLSESDVFARILADLEPMEKRSRRFMRYFSLAPLYNQGLGEDELQTYRHALSKLVNSLSWHPRVTVPQPIDPAKVVLRIDLRDFMWDANLWNRLLAEYPYGILQDTAVARAASVATASKLPVVRGDWFIATACRPPLYVELLQLPANVAELERQLRVDVAVNLLQERVARAGFTGSGVARNNRLLERHDAVHGAYWRTYDFEEVPQNLVERDTLLPDRRNLFAYPLGPAGFNDLSFQHAGGEVIFNLPNGLHAYMLVNANGIRIDKANTAIVSDPRRPDRAVETGISCMSCHYRGINIKDDQIRDYLDKNPKAFARKDAELIRALYAPKAKMRALMEADAERFAQAVARTGARVSAFEPVSTMTLRYEADLDLATAAAEAGVPAGLLVERVGTTEQLARNLGALKAAGGTVQRQVFLQAFADLVRELRLGVALQPGLVAQSLPDNTGEIDPLEGISASANGAAFAPDGRRALLASADKSIVVWDVETGRELRRLVGHTGSVWTVAFSPDGRQALSGGADRTVRLWDLETGQELRRFEGHENLVTSVAFAPDSRRALSAGYDHVVMLWDVPTGRAVRVLEDLGRYINHVEFAPDGRRALVCAEQAIVLIEPETGRTLGRLDGHAQAVEIARFAADGTTILSGGDDGTVRLWDLAGRQLKVFSGHTGPVKAVAFGADGSQILSGSADRTVRLWDVASGQELRRFGKHGESVLAVAFINSDRQTLSASRDAAVLTWNLVKGPKPVEPTPVAVQPVAPPVGPTLKPAAVWPVGATVANLTLSPDRRSLYFLNLSDAVAVRLNAATLQKEAALPLSDRAETLTLSPDGKTLYAATVAEGESAGGKIHAINAATMQLAGTYKLPTVPYDLAAADAGLVYISGAKGDWTDITVLNTKQGTVTGRWGGIWNRSLLRLSPRQDRLYVSSQGVNPGQVDTLLIPERPADKPVLYTSPERGRQPLGGQFLVSPDGQFLLLKTGVVLGLATTQADDLKHVTTLEPFLAAAVDPEAGALFLLTAEGTLKQFSYPDFRPVRSWPLGIVAYQAALDGKQGRLYVAGFDPRTLTERPRSRGLGDIFVYDLSKALSVGSASKQAGN